MAPTPQTCPVPSCDYKTPATLPTYEMLYKDLDLHTRYGHPEAQHEAPAQRGGVAGGGPKPDKLPRPQIGEGASQSDWMYFKNAWERYKRSTRLEGQTAIDQLWACASEELARSVYDSGMQGNFTEVDLLAAMEKLSVRAQNRLVNVVSFLGMSQDSEEPAGSFAARLRGQGAICDFTIKCTSDTCLKENSYVDHMVSHQLVRGLADAEIQEQVLSHAATNTDLDLASITKFIEAKETGKRSTAQIAAAVGLNRISDHKMRDNLAIMSKMFHYTTLDSAKNIFQTNQIKASGSGAYGAGVYLTRIGPNEGMSKVLSNNWDGANPGPAKVECYFEITIPQNKITKEPNSRDIWTYDGTNNLRLSEHVWNLFSFDGELIATQYYRISSTGPAAANGNQPTSMGLYRICNTKSGSKYPLYKKVDGKRYLYMNTNTGNWLVGPTAYKSDCNLCQLSGHKQSPPPDVVWQYSDGTRLVEDLRLSVTPDYNNV